MWKSVTKYQSTLRKIQKNEDLVYTAAETWNQAKSKHKFHVQLLFKKPRRRWDNVEIYCTAGQATDENAAHAQCMLDI
jgi:hypothetical protein